MKTLKFTIFGLTIFLIFALSLSAQTKKRGIEKPILKISPTVAPTPAETSSDDVSAPKTPAKKNERPSDGENDPSANNLTKNPPVYFYEFSQPNFTTSQVSIEHDENGQGKITFLKQSYTEAVSDPLNLSAEGAEKVKTLWQNLNFLDSTENYQYEKDYSHLGNMKFTMKKDNRERSAKFNWTENKDAKALADAYRKISNQYIWLFDFGVARENQPLETPRLMDSLDSLIKRDEIFEVSQMLPFLKKITDDEHIPLIARNHATRLVQQFEKQTTKKQEDKK